MPPLLEVTDLAVHFDRRGGGVARAVDGVSFTVAAGETLGLVGESGCGKSVTSLALPRLLPRPPARYAGGSVRFGGRDTASMGPGELRALRGGGMGVVFQEPMSSLNPVMAVGPQVAEALLAHRRGPDPGDPEADRPGLARGGPAWAAARVERALAEVGLPDPARTARRYPHELSGGMKQRVMVAMALVAGPRLLICDEPTTALDVTVQARILALLARLRDRRGMGMLFVTHNMGVVAGLADRVAVMYAGRLAESGPTAALFARPLHPYTRGLMACVPRLEEAGAAPEGGNGRLATIPGRVPDPSAYPEGCRFWPRCPRADGLCRREAPPWREAEPGRWCACHRAGA